jgi:hypothetical protein
MNKREDLQLLEAGAVKCGLYATKAFYSQTRISPSSLWVSRIKSIRTLCPKFEMKHAFVIPEILRVPCPEKQNQQNASYDIKIERGYKYIAHEDHESRSLYPNNLDIRFLRFSPIAGEVRLFPLLLVSRRYKSKLEARLDICKGAGLGGWRLRALL